jgi:hypothetical protein
MSPHPAATALAVSLGQLDDKAGTWANMQPAATHLPWPPIGASGGGSVAPRNCCSAGRSLGLPITRQLGPLSLAGGQCPPPPQAAKCPPAANSRQLATSIRLHSISHIPTSHSMSCGGTGNQVTPSIATTSPTSHRSCVAGSLSLISANSPGLGLGLATWTWMARSLVTPQLLDQRFSSPVPS